MTDSPTAPNPTTEETAIKAHAEATPTASKGSEKKGRPAHARRSREKVVKEFDEEIVKIDRVTRVTAGGRQMRFRVSVVIGDRKGRVGFGIGKSEEVVLAIQKAITVAKKSLITVPIFKDSIPHEITSDFKASRILLFPAPTGTGVIAGGAVRLVLDLAGIQNVRSKIHRSRNRLNAVRATMQALQSLQNRAPVEGGKNSAENSSESEAGTENAPAEKKATEKPKAENKKPSKTKKATNTSAKK